MTDRKLFNLSGKTAWVVGGYGYLGVPVCRELACHGAHVVIAGRRGEAAEETSAKLVGEGLSVEAMELDISDESDVVAAADRLDDRHGRIDVVVNATCFSTGMTMERMSLDDWRAGMKVSLDGAFVLAREAGRVMALRKSGSIIQFSSMYGIVSPDPRIYGTKQNVNPVDYGVAKAGILQLVRYQAVMLAPYGVRVNAVVPGPFPNPDGQGSDAEFTTRLCEKVPMGRVGKAEEITGAVVFLASDASSYVTGTQIVVDGGWTAW